MSRLTVIGGMYRSRLLKTPKGKETRPTRSVIRESMFNILQGRFFDSHVLDLFAGSGSLGFEALSRGAAFVAFCDISKDAMETVRDNAKMLKAEGRCEFLLGHWKPAVERLGCEMREFDVIFLDPPYLLDYQEIIGVVVSQQLLSKEGIIIIEHSKQTMITAPEAYRLKLSRDYGQTILTFLERLGQENA